MAKDELEFDDLYNEFLNSTGDPVTAAQYAAYQYIINPTGSIKQIKMPDKWYSDKEWLDYEAPDYVRAVEYSGDDPLSQFTSEVFKNTDRLQNEGLTYLQEQARQADLTDTGLSTQDYYNQIKDYYNQWQSAQTKIKNQKSTHTFIKYGLPDPTTRYVVNPAEVVEGKTELFPFTVGKNKESIPEVVTRKVNEINQQLQSRGMDKSLAKEYAVAYGKKLFDTYQQQINASNISPFVVAAARRRQVAK